MPIYFQQDVLIVKYKFDVSFTTKKYHSLYSLKTSIHLQGSNSAILYYRSTSVWSGLIPLPEEVVNISDGY